MSGRVTRSEVPRQIASLDRGRECQINPLTLLVNLRQVEERLGQYGRRAGLTCF
jgi:hypothetical protein